MIRALGRALPARLTPCAVVPGSRSFSESLQKVIFTAHGQSDTNAREGHVKSTGEKHGNLNLKLEKHPGQGGPGGGTNPEELFSLGYAACFNGALRLVAQKAKIPIGESTVSVDVSLGLTQVEPMRVGIAAKVHAQIKDVDDETAQKVTEMAHEFCPYSRATRGNIDVEVKGSAV